MEKYKVSIATACYNSENFIERTFQSIVEQHYDNLEWNVVIDGSRDSTQTILEACRLRATFPIHITPLISNQGPTAAIGIAVQTCVSDFAMILDHDDELMPRALHGLLETWDSVAQNQDMEAISGIFGRCVNEKNEFLGRRLVPPILVTTLGYFLYVKRCNAECAALFKTSILKEYYHFAPEELGSTNGLIWNRMSREYRSIFTNLVMRRYHTQVPGSMSSSRVTKTPAAIANQELELLNDNADYFLSAPVLFLKKLAIYERHSYRAKHGLLRPLRALRDPRMRLAAACLWPLAIWMAKKDERSVRAT